MLIVKDLAFSFYLFIFAVRKQLWHIFMSKVDYDEQFERLWYENKHRLLKNDREYREEVERYKMTSGADWLLFGIPAVVGIASFEMITFESEMMRWVVSALITIVTFIASVFVKSLVTGGKPISDIEDRIKNDCYKRYTETGKI